MRRKISLLVSASTLGGLFLLVPALSSHSQQAEVQPALLEELHHANVALEALVDTAIQQWEQAATIVVKPEAKAQIARELSGFLGAGISEKTKAILAKAYLYELRDVSARREFHHMSTIVSISSADLRTLSLDSYVRETALGKRVGYLRCVSDPAGGEITIDSQPRGVTIKEFVLSTGEHNVAIDLGNRHCEKKVVIEEEKLTETRCSVKK